MLPARIRAALWLALPLFALTGCGYVHFGRMPTVLSDQELINESTDLKLQKKILQHELAVARKEGDVLRAVLDNHGTPVSNTAAAELAAKLNETTRELTVLRESYARLQEQRSGIQGGPVNFGAGAISAMEQVSDLKGKLSATEEKLANALRTYTELQEETSRLRSEVARVQTDNANLTTQVKNLIQENREAQTALAELNTEFLAQKIARTQAEQDADAIRSQMQAVMARTADAPKTLSAARETSATGAREIDAPLRAANLPAAEQPTARLATSTDRLQAIASGQPAPKVEPPAIVKAADPLTEAPTTIRYYITKEGDTIESIAKQYYGRPESWVKIYAANNAQLSGGRSVKPGMRLEIPAE